MNISVYIAVLPVLLLSIYIYRKDIEKEPLTLLFKLLLGGVLSCLSVLVVDNILAIFIKLFTISTTQMSALELFLYSFLCVALVEESCKWIYLYLFSYSNKEFDTLFDMIVYGVFVSLGFALFENIFYVSGYGIATGLVRAFTAIPLHGCCGVFMGIFLGKSKYAELTNNKKDEKKYKLYSILMPVMIHGMYDFCAISNNFLLLITVVCVLLTVTVVLINKKNKLDIKIVKYEKNLCPNCGTKINGKFCSNCGKRLY